MARSKGSWTELGKAKVESSALTVSVAEELGMYEVASAKTVDPLFDARPALVIPYMGWDKRPMSAHPKWPNFYRVRYLTDDEDDEGPAPSKGFGDIVAAAKAEEKKKKRYVQPEKTGVCAYFPTVSDWMAIGKDTDVELMITEGELKAACASFFEFPTIGLGGVYSFKSAKQGMLWLPELDRVDWAQRTVYICYDSDFYDNVNICNAINALADELDERGAFVKCVYLPDVYEDDRKTGLDDFLMAKGPEELGNLLRQAEPLGISRGLWRVNKEVIYVDDPGMVIVQSSGQKLSPDNFKSHSRWATESTMESRMSPKGSIVHEKVGVAAHWLKWPLRKSARGVTYAPGDDKLTEGGYWNQWPGWGVEPVKGDVKPFLQLVDYLFAEAPDQIDWFLDWCAYPVQHPGTKLFSAVVIHSIVQGTGKTLLGYTLGEVYGRNFKEINDDHLEQTDWAENKQFILGDEVSGKDNRQYSNALKRLITGRVITVDIKFVPRFDLPNCMNFMFTSQHADAFFLEDRDRRYFVIEVHGDPLPQEFYDKYDEWLWRGNGPAHLMHWLQSRKISKKFNPAGHAPRTAAKDRMIQATKGDVASWVHDLVQYPEQHLRVGQMRHTRDLFTSKELLDMYANEAPNHKVTVNGMARVLASAGCVQVDGGQPIKGPDGKMARYFAVRNTAHWRKCKNRKEMEKNAAMTPVREGKAK